jgi:hypothetical protein
MDSTKQAMLSAIDMKAALMVRVAPPTWMALWCRELVHDTVVTLTGLQLEPACWCGCCTLLLPVLAAARLALSSGLLVGVFTMAAVVLAVQVCLSGARSLVGRQSSCLCSGCGDLVVWSDVASLRSWWLPLCHFVNRRFQASLFTSFLCALSFLDLILPFYLDLLETSRSTLELLAFGARLA